MAGQITGKFVADFASFNDAVNKAVVHLKGMETGASKVQTSLDRMVDSLGGRKLVQEATLAAEAVERIGGASKLTHTELQKLGAQADEATKKLKALGQEVPPGIKKISDAAADARQKLEEQNKAADKGALSFGTLFSSFTAANLAATAIQKLGAAVTEAIDRSQKLPGIESSFKKLSTSIGQDSAAMVATLQGATKGLVGEMELMQTVNKAVLLGLPVTTASMGEMATAATKLGLAMGKDATSSIDDLITALGRSSPMILDNLGLTVKVGEANEEYARKLGKTADQLTTAEQKTAFYEAAMEAARKKSKELGDESLTLGQIMQTVWVTGLDAATRYFAYINKKGGEILSSPGLGLMAETDETRLDKIEKQMDEMGRSGGEVAKAWGKVSGQITNTSMAAADLELVTKELDRTYQSTGKTISENAAAAHKLDEALKKAATAGAKAFKDFHEGIKNVNVQMEIFVGKHLQELGTRGYKILQSTGEAAVKLGLDMSGLHPVIEGLSDDFMKMSATGIQAARNLPPEIKKAKFEFDDLSKAITQLATIAGGTFGAMASGLGTLVGAANAAKTAIQQIKDASKITDKFEGILGMTTGIMGIVTAALAAVNAIKGIWGAINQREGRHAVEDFADSFGGFDALHQKLLDLGDAGEQLWIKLTQGVPAGNADAAARVIAEIEAALGNQAKAVDEVTEATEEQAQATIETASQAAKALEELGPRIDANKTEWQGWGDLVTAQIQRIADGIRALPMPGATLPSAATITAGAASSGIAAPNIDVTLQMPNGDVLLRQLVLTGQRQGYA